MKVPNLNVSWLGSYRPYRKENGDFPVREVLKIRYCPIEASKVTHRDMSLA